MMRPRMLSQPWARSVALWGSPLLIRSVQRGTFSNGTNTSGTTTISAVDVANSVAVVLGCSSNNSGSAQSGNLSHWSCSITAATTLSWTRLAANGVTCTASYEVWEFAPGLLKSIQFATVAISATNNSGNTTITSVNTAKSIVIPCGWQIQNVSLVDDQCYAYCSLTGATTVNMQKTTAAAASANQGTVCVAEFN